MAPMNPATVDAPPTARIPWFTSILDMDTVTQNPEELACLNIRAPVPQARQGCQHWLYQRCRRHDPKGIGAGYHMDDGRDDDGDQDGREGGLYDDVRNLLSNACVLYKGCQGAAHTGNNNWHCSCNDSFIYPVV